MNTKASPFFDFIKHLRLREEIILQNQIFEIAPGEEDLVRAFHESQFQNESLEFPYVAPAYDAAAGLWGAKTAYIASQLLLFREHKEKDIPALLPAYAGEVTVSAMLSVDLCLRFVPVIIMNAARIDAEDAMVSILETHLKTWHYSAIGYSLDTKELNFDLILSNDCLKQLYLNRVVELKAKRLAEIPALEEGIRENAGNFVNEFWK